MGFIFEVFKWKLVPEDAPHCCKSKELSGSLTNRQNIAVNISNVHSIGCTV